MNVEYLVSVSHHLALNKSLTFVHTAVAIADERVDEVIGSNL